MISENMIAPEITCEVGVLLTASHSHLAMTELEDKG